MIESLGFLIGCFRSSGFFPLSCT